MGKQKATSPPVRARNQQRVISIFCVCAAVAVFVWMIFASIDLRLKTTAPGDDSSAIVAVDKKNENEKKPKPEESSSDEGSSEETPARVSDSPADFSDACFIGDSRTVGLSYNSGKPLATFYCATGLNVSSALDEANIELDNGNMGNVVDALGQREFGRIFINFGINEVGWPYLDSFQAEYEELINAVKAAQPSAKIYVESIIPVIALFNTAVKAAADKCGVEYIDISPAFVDASGALPEDAASDGIHLVKDYLVKWIAFLEQNT